MDEETEYMLQEPLLPGSVAEDYDEDEPAHAKLPPLLPKKVDDALQNKLPPLPPTRRPKNPPPVEAFGLLPDHFALDAERVLLRSRPPTAITDAEAQAKAQAAAAEAARVAAVHAAEEAAKRAAEQAELDQEKRDLKRGKRKAGDAKPYLPPPPPMPPPRPAKILSGVVPRGKLQIKLQRAVGIGAGTGGMGGRINRFTTGSCFLKWELVLGGGQAIVEQEATTAKTTPVVRLSAKSPVFKDITLSDWRPPVPKGVDSASVDEDSDPGLVTFKYTNGVASVPMPDALAEEDKVKLPPLLFYSVWWTGLGFMKSDELIAEGVVPASSFLVKGVGKWADACLPLFAPGTAAPGGMAALFTSYMLVSVKFIATIAGILTLSLHDGRGLKDMELIGGGKNDVYCRLQMGDWVGKHPPAGLPAFMKTATIVEGGTDPAFGDQEMLLWIDHSLSLSGVPIVMTVWDENKMARDTLLAKYTVPLSAWTGDYLQHSEVLHMTDAKGEAAGKVSLTRKWHPAGELAVRIVSGRNMVAKDMMGSSDTYIKVSLDGRTRTYNEKTGVADKSGTDPQFQQQFVFDVVDHSEMKLAAWDKDMFTADDLIGEVTVDLNNVFRYGVRDGWVPMKLKGDWGGYEDRGELRVECDFTGPKGLAYPQLRPDQVSFDDRERSNRLGLSAEDTDRVARAAAAKEAEIAAERELALRELSGEDYRDSEIQKAFETADLDGNLVLSAGEVRHLLICMGELVTDPEVDEMIGMCDKDGDGGVAFYEFYQMAKTSLVTLSSKAWKPSVEDKFREAVAGPAVVPPPIVIYGPNGEVLQVIEAGAGLDARKRAMQRAQDMAKKGEKKGLCEALVKLQALRLTELQRIFRRFTGMDQFEEGYVTLPELLELFDAEGAGSAGDMWKELYAVFMRPGMGKLYVRELLLALNNFTGATKPQKVNFAFFLFDADESGSLSKDEVVQILRANHLAADDASVQAKAATIMAAADRDNSDSVSLEEFVVIASRFPNVLFPNFAMSTDEALERVGLGDGPGSDGKGRPTTAMQNMRATDEQVAAYTEGIVKGPTPLKGNAGRQAVPG